MARRVLGVFVRTVFAYHRRRARDRGVAGGEPGAVTAIQLAGSFANSHLHCTLSPLTPALVAQLRAVHAAGTGDATVFAKIGDSHTVSTSYLQCFAGSAFELAGRDLEATRAHFAAGDAAGTSPYQRTTLAATVGWAASRRSQARRVRSSRSSRRSRRRSRP